ncbi:hypothetical protein [Leeia aquatica]|uniref:Uncharacterized protein n=1 Tax=Leeia aquatica TaxID=2725557 RepID=A0A847S4P7_9NEIS|nr:hypothetical protein [Leeia aquatica]NLR74107.1 hypothetical protein [Leeia aquatica]
MQEDLNISIKKELINFEAHIDAYYSSLNTEGVWLFLATLGCWGVSPAWPQLHAIVLTVILFMHRTYLKFNDKRSLKTISKDLESKIKNELDAGDTQKARLHDLQQIHNIKLSTTSQFKSTIIFFLCYTFLVVTVWHWFSIPKVY